YHNRGVDYDYFPAELTIWIEAIESLMSPQEAEPIVALYRWMLNMHEQVIPLSQIEAEGAFDHDEHYITLQQQLLGLLLEGNHRAAQELFKEQVQNWDHCQSFFINVIHPTMQRIGLEWENGRITSAEEHLATAIVYKLLSFFYYMQENVEQKRGVAVVTAAPNEFHEMGAWMVASALEMDGWDVKYLGANTPQTDLLTVLRESNPTILAISAALPIHVQHIVQIVAAIRKDEQLSRLKIMVGGYALDTMPKLFESTGADAYLQNSVEAVVKAREWQN
ncbi:MAG: cobalamin-dependent protein, partial [Sulfurimonadaceae bacterium]|nr:cobalamin-dependent protein [Sulfurimonadaceae bacterium]